MKLVKIFLFVISCLLLVKITFFYPANEPVQHKLKLIDEQIKLKGFTPYYFTISGKRWKWYNKLLPNADKKNSYHLKGEAIDIYVLDVDGDGAFTTNDIRIVEEANNVVEKKHPALTGAFGTYLSKGYFSKHMIHFDTRGRRIRY